MRGPSLPPPGDPRLRHWIAERSAAALTAALVVGDDPSVRGAVAAALLVDPFLAAWAISGSADRGESLPSTALAERFLDRLRAALAADADSSGGSAADFHERAGAALRSVAIAALAAPDDEGEYLAALSAAAQAGVGGDAAAGRQLPAEVCGAS